MSAINFVSDDVSQTYRIAAALAHQCRAGDCILLKGELGAGKTTFARGFIQALYPTEEEIVSPTFTLVQTYPARPAAIWHFDLYRLKSPQELDEIGLDEALLGGISLIEWPELAQNALPAAALTVIIAIDDSQRTIALTGEAAAWSSRLEAVKNLE